MVKFSWGNLQLLLQHKLLSGWFLIKQQNKTATTQNAILKGFKLHFVGNIAWLTSRLSINFYTHARQIVPFFWCKADKQRFDGFCQVSLYHVPGIRISLKYLLKGYETPISKSLIFQKPKWIIRLGNNHFISMKWQWMYQCGLLEGNREFKMWWRQH